MIYHCGLNLQLDNGGGNNHTCPHRQCLRMHVCTCLCIAVSTGKSGMVRNELIEVVCGYICQYSTYFKFIPSTHTHTHTHTHSHVPFENREPTQSPPPLDCLKRWQSDHKLPSSQIQWACYKKWKVDWEALTWMCQSMVNISFQNSCGYTALGMPEWREMTPRIDRRAKQPSQVACVSENLKYWVAWNTTCGHKAKDITPQIAWTRKAWKKEALGEDLPWKDEWGPSSVWWTLELFQGQRWENFWETRWSACGLFRAHRYHHELNNCIKILRLSRVTLARAGWSLYGINVEYGGKWAPWHRGNGHGYINKHKTTSLLYMHVWHHEKTTKKQCVLACFRLTSAIFLEISSMCWSATNESNLPCIFCGSPSKFLDCYLLL